MQTALLCPYSLDTPGGVGTHVLGLASWLAGQGHAVHVIAPGTVARTSGIGVTVHLMGGSRDFRFNGSVAQLALGRRQIAEAVEIARHAELVHVHEPLTPGLAFSVARASGNLVVTHHASFSPGRLLGPLLRRRSAAFSPGAAIAVSPAARLTAESCGVRVSEVIGNGIVLPDAPPASSGLRGGVRPCIGFLGRLDEPRKGFDLFREVAQRFARAGLAADFVALGPGGADPGPVNLLGAVDDAMRNEMLQSIDVLLAPNLYGESFGLILVEALAAGCDVVASDLPGFRDVLAQAGMGATFQTGDVDAAMAALQLTLQHPQNPSQLHAAAQPWSWDVLGPQVLAVYERASRQPGDR